MALDPISAGILTGLLSNSLTTLVTCGAPTLERVVKFRGDIKRALEKDDIVALNIQKVLEILVKSEPFLSNSLLSDRAKSFLQSATAENIVRQIYSDDLKFEGKPTSMKDVHEEFIICLARHLGVDRKTIEESGTEMLNLIVTSCDRTLKIAIDKGALAAHEAKSTARDKVMIQELRAIRKNIEFLSANPTLEASTIDDFERRYRHQVGVRQGTIQVPHLNRAQSVDINELFVAPNFLSSLTKEPDERKPIPLSCFLVSLYRTVVLGDPGGGKSTLAQKICYDLDKGYEQRPICGRQLTPIIVILREYSAEKKKRGYSILQFIESEVTSKYQLPEAAPRGAFEWLLHNGHLIVIFDGLDELLEPSHRREISKDIELFADLFPSTPILVTSRVVGYEQAPLNPKMFETFYVAPFDYAQVADYVGKWFRIDTKLTADEQKLHKEAFLSESNIVSDLRANPLMLALMCNLYRGAGFIPRNRPEVYRKCSEMLFERWDPSRGIWAKQPLSEPKVLLSQIAYWFYNDEARQSGVTEQALVAEATRFLYPRRFESEEQAEHAAKQFIEFCRGRAWVFTDVGTTAQGVYLYKFTHKTFLEYFTAAHVVRNNNSAKKLWAILRPKIAERAWDVVAQLAFQMLHEQVEAASDDLFSLLLRDAQANAPSRWRYISFGARCLQFIHSAPKTIRNLTEAAVKYMTDTNAPSDYSTNGEIVEALLHTAPECISTVEDCFVNKIIEVIQQDSDERSVRAFGLATGLSFAVRRRREIPQKEVEYWNKVEGKILDRTDARIEALARKNSSVALLRFHRRKLTIEKLVDWFGPDTLFREDQNPMYGFWYISAVGAILYGTPWYVGTASRVEEPMVRGSQRAAAEIGAVVPKMKLPCFSARVLQREHHNSFENITWRRRRHLESGNKVESSSENISGEAVVGLWAIWAVLFEVEQEKDSDIIEMLGKYEDPVERAVTAAMLARLGKETPDKALEKLKAWSLPVSGAELIGSWMRGQISLVSS